MSSSPLIPPATSCFRRRFISLQESPGSIIEGVPLFQRGEWPCHWIHPEKDLDQPAMLYFRLCFSLNEQLPFSVHLTADERYRFFIDGVEVAEGSERGDIGHWYFDTFDVCLEAGEHAFVAEVNALRHAAMRSQISLRHGFLFCPDSFIAAQMFGSGREAVKWEYRQDYGYKFAEPFTGEAYSVGWNCIHDGRLSMLQPAREGVGHWKPALKGLPGANPLRINRSPQRHLLYPATLPDPVKVPVQKIKVLSIEKLAKDTEPEHLPWPETSVCEETIQEWQQLFEKQRALQFPEGGLRLRILLDLQDYVCADVLLVLFGGKESHIRIRFAESLFEDATHTTKGVRDRYVGKFFRGIGDSYICGGDRQSFRSVHWRSGRFVEILLEKAEPALRIDSLNLINRGYPLEVASRLQTDLPGFHKFCEQAMRTVRASAHDSLIDGPYYEQMCWIGDSLQTSLTHFVLFRDSRLIEKCLKLFDVSRTQIGMIRARWPARDSMIIVPYAFSWIDTVYSFALWRRNPAFVRSLLPGLRTVVEALLQMRNRDGLIEVHQGWAFVDWVPGWSMGIAPGADGGVNACINWHCVSILARMAKLEAAFGEPAFSDRCHRIATDMSECLCDSLWHEGKGRFADTPDRQTFSEHGQAFAVLSGLLPKAILANINLEPDGRMTPSTIAFSHFLLEAYHKLDLPDLFFRRLEDWRPFQQNGLLTLPEGPEPSRSDCHAWSAHPYYHYFASILGVRPSAFGFKAVKIKPMLTCPYDSSGVLPHPDGDIQVSIRRSRGHQRSLCIQLPAGVPGMVEIDNRQIAISPGGHFQEHITPLASTSKTL